MRKREKF